MGTIINAVAIVITGIVGTLLGDRLPVRMRQTVVAGLGVISLLIGLQMALKTQHLLVVLGSIVLGGVIGEVLDLDGKMDSLGQWFERRLMTLGFARNAGDEGDSARTRPGFSRGFVVASLMFCIGPMAIVGSMQDGLTGDYQLLAVKSMLDGFGSIAFASTLGIGVAFSALPVLLYQGGLTLGAGWLKTLLTEAMITEMTAAGGLLIVAMSLQILGFGTSGLPICCRQSPSRPQASLSSEPGPRLPRALDRSRDRLLLQVRHIVGEGSILVLTKG